MAIHDPDVRGVLLDIEGTTSSVRFVYDVMFPFVLRELDEFLLTQGDQPEVVAACAQIARDAGRNSLVDWCAATGGTSRQTISEEVRRLMAADVKATGLKELQGLIWQAGFESGELVAHVYPDVVPALTAWRERGIELRIYSSGSVAAQRLFFGHTEYGDLLPYFSAHYDTTVGAKKDAASYRAIAADVGIPAGQLLFLSDVVAELDAAREVGWQTGLCCRPGNTPAEEGAGRHPRIDSFADVHLGG